MEPVLEFDCRERGPARFEEAVFGRARAGPDCFVAPGLAEMVNGGTLAVHHVHLLTEQQQERLAQTTREGVVRRLGSDRDIETRYRLVMTAEADRSTREGVGALCPRLRELVQPDWVEVPRIRGRSDRVMSFVARMLETYAGSRQCLGPAIKEFSTHYPLSCTLSDLKRAVERASEVGAEGPVEGEDLGIPTLEGFTAGGGTTKRHFVSWAESKRAFETYYLCRLLAEAEGNVTQAAALSGRGRQQIHRALKKCGISGAAFRQAEGECC
jgi:two-component system nitrogen regulation response regulator NtrX